MSLPIYVIGHKNPDTDSICSALALAELKQRLGVDAVAARLGHANPETKFILNKLNLDLPFYLTSAKCTLQEIDIDEAVTIHDGETIRSAWDLCMEKSVKTLYVIDDEDKYIGMATLGDISKVQMQDLNITKDLLKQTPLENLAKVVKGKILYEGTNERSGYVRISDKRLMERDLEGAIMVLSDHEDEMIKSMGRGCAVIVIAENYVPADYIIEMAKSEGVTLINTPYNTMKIIQMIYRAIPVRLIMTPKDKLITFNQTEFVEDVEREMLKTRHSSYPVVSQDKLVGSVARYNLLKSEKKKLILVDHNELKQSIDDIEQGEIVEIVDHHRIGDIETDRPIVFRNMTVGSTCTIVEMMYREAGIRMSDTVARLVAYGVISDTMNFHSPTCTDIDRNLKKRLEEEYGLDTQAMADDLFQNTATIEGRAFKDILYNDVKEYVLSGYRISISQVFTYDLNVVDTIHDDFLKFMEEEEKNKNHRNDLTLMVFTNVEGKGSRFLYVGSLSKMLASSIDQFADRGFVSRKKQIVPGLAQALV
ncbi:putative manganese-dependent inorganic diphosphatase [Catenisphaera adipataccumulans]|jgi:manganese-dependent inorganic pyrophosphatase|uniref:inorganic diphosphatase n=1 Tax=Catenisphaera adipataccumulans TaxID=700500 RepID=A0A7W8CX53_9FIRM|nr:putative manganese-dependent inorganic diphosphatase [Catenisphaera adipataccumulans]MBB5182941.1 manganese-dependent inorganic pyrophosphatase [Catenisphaera adipataccumulans]